MTGRNLYLGIQHINQIIEDDGCKVRKSAAILRRIFTSIRCKNKCCPGKRAA
jgi:hypothetical protein